MLAVGRKPARSLDALSRVAAGPDESEIYLPALLNIAFDLRFTANAAAKHQAVLGSPSVLGLAARGALSFDMPEAQAALGVDLLVFHRHLRRSTGAAKLLRVWR